MEDVQRQFKPKVIRVLLAVATVSLADAINKIVEGVDDIEIVGVITSAEGLLSKVQEKSPHVVCVHDRIDDRWDEYAKQVSNYSKQLQEEAAIPVQYGRWQLKRDYRVNNLSTFYLPRVATKKWQRKIVRRAMKRIAIAIMSPDDGAELLRRMLQSGARFHLLMPLHREQFLATIHLLTTYSLSKSIICQSG